MKRLLIVALAATVATPSFAQAVTEIQSTQFQGNRAVECDLTGIAQQIDFGSLGRRGQAGARTDGNIDLFCNQPFSASLKSTSGYLRLNAANPLNLSSETTANFESLANPGFAAGLDYEATVTFGSLSVTGDTSQIAAGVNTVLAPRVPAQNAQNASIRYVTKPGSLPLLGGDYFDTLTITLTTLGV
jgi:spore coat protein U-like protein